MLIYAYMPNKSLDLYLFGQQIFMLPITVYAYICLVTYIFELKSLNGSNRFHYEGGIMICESPSPHFVITNKVLIWLVADPTRRNLLDWRKRVDIIEGVTQGLLYLQEYSNFTVIHRDLKASNILLDNEMNPKILDFGMARIFRKDEHEANTGRIVGT